MRLDLYANVDTEVILKAIGLEERNIPRLRGVGIDDGKILIHTRTGGGNRESYDSITDAVEGEYGINQSISDYENPTSDYIKKMSKSDREKTLADLRERKKEVLKDASGTNEYMTRNEFYLYDEDEEFDCTYANFWFKIPEKLEKKLLNLENKEAKAVLGDTETAIGLMFGDKKAIKEAESRLKEIK